MTESPKIAVPHFTPVPLARARHDGWTEARQRIFLAALDATGIVASAARAADMSVTSAYNPRRRAGAESFAAAWDKVLDQARERALAHVVEHFINGETVPRFYRGRFVGAVHRVDHRIALAALRAAMPVAPRRRRPKCND